MTYRLVIADDHAMSLNGLAQALEQTGRCRIEGRATNGIAAIALIRRILPDCAVIDLSMPGCSGLEVVIEGRRWSPQTRFVVLSGLLTAASLHALIAAGISGAFLKAADPDRICAGIVDVAAGKTAFGEETRALLQDSGKAQDLTPRETEVLQAIALGLSNTGIAARLGVSPKTVDSHRTSLMRKLGVNSTASLLVKAMRLDLLHLP